MYLNKLTLDMLSRMTARMMKLLLKNEDVYMLVEIILLGNLEIVQMRSRYNFLSRFVPHFSAVDCGIASEKLI